MGEKWVKNGSKMHFSKSDPRPFGIVKQVFLACFESVVRSQRLGSFPNLAILFPRWWPCQIQVLSQKLTADAPGRGHQVGRCPPKMRILCPKTAFFGPKRPRNQVKTAKGRESVATLHVRLDCPVTKSSFLHSNSTIRPRNSPKMAKNGPNLSTLCQIAPKPRTGRILGYVTHNGILRAPSPPATPHFLRFPSLQFA